MSAVDPNQGRGPSLVDLSARLDLADLHAANIARQAEWCPEQVPDLSFRGNELGGECGEAQNVIKKLERERLGWRGSRATLDDLGQELADVVICADLCAVTAGIDLAAVVRAKFNATSEKIGLSTRLEAPTPPQPPLGEAEVRRIVREVCARLYDDEGLSGVGEPDEAALIRSGERDECLTWSFAAGLAVAEHLRSAALPSASTGGGGGVDHTPLADRIADTIFRATLPFQRELVEHSSVTFRGLANNARDALLAGPIADLCRQLEQALKWARDEQVKRHQTAAPPPAAETDGWRDQRLASSVREIVRAAHDLCDGTENGGSAEHPNIVDTDLWTRLSEALTATVAIIPSDEHPCSAGHAVTLLMEAGETDGWREALDGAVCAMHSEPRRRAFHAGFNGLKPVDSYLPNECYEAGALARTLLLPAPPATSPEGR